MKVICSSLMKRLSSLGRGTIAAGLISVAILGVSVGSREPTATEAQVVQLCPILDAYWNVCIYKLTDPSDTGAEFEFEYNVENDIGPDGGGGFVIQDQQYAHFVLTADAEEVTIGETGMPPGWDLVDIECVLTGTDPSISQEIDLQDQSVTIGLLSGPGIIYCTFSNELDERETPVPTPPTDRRPPNIGAGLSGLFGSGPAPATPTVVAPAAPAPSRVISPPNTGDAGLK